MKKVFFITTAHLSEGLWFRDDEDFKVGMNFVAIQAWRSGVVILSFVLMSNHLHFVLIGTEESVRDFICGLKGRYSLYLRKNYGYKEFLRRNDVDIREIDFEDEALERAIAYVQMNPVAANICLHPTQYRWGTGNAFFNGERTDGVPVGKYSGRALEKLLHSNSTNLPTNYIIGANQYVLPESYVDVAGVEKLFRTPGRMNYFLTNSAKARRRLEKMDNNLPAFRDQVITNAIPDLLSNLFKKRSQTELNEKELIEFLRQLMFRFCADVHQISRITGLSYEEIARLLDKA